MWKRASAPQRRDARARAEALLGRLGVPPEEAASLVAALPELPEDSFASRALRQGGDTLEAWLASRDPNVPLRLNELIAEWRRGDPTLASPSAQPTTRGASWPTRPAC